MVSDGTNLTSGTREQSDFLTPSLTAPDGTRHRRGRPSEDRHAVAAQKHRVLLARPEATGRHRGDRQKPFNAPGTYVVYNASSQLIADVVVQCSGTS